MENTKRTNKIPVKYPITDGVFEYMKRRYVIYQKKYSYITDNYSDEHFSLCIYNYISMGIQFLFTGVLRDEYSEQKINLTTKRNRSFKSFKMII